jgi:hypothetical protein
MKTIFFFYTYVHFSDVYNISVLLFSIKINAWYEVPYYNISESSFSIGPLFTEVYI